MEKKEILREITVATSIYDPKLPQKIVTALADTPLNLVPNDRIELEILFSNNVYQQAEFYQYELTINHMRPEPKTESEKKKQKIYDILSEQLDKVSASLKENGYSIRNAAIIGDDLENDSVHIIVYRQETPVAGKRKAQTEIRINSILPDRPLLIKQAGRMLAEILWERMQKERETELAKKAHTPNYVSADRLFSAISDALSEEIEDMTKLTTDKLIASASFDSEWPLRICRKNEADQEKVCSENTQIDCPEYIISYLNHDGNWRLEKLENLRAAQYIISNEGFRHKKTQSIIVLKNLKIIPYLLFADTEEGLISVSPVEAYRYKKLLVSWKKTN